MNNINEADSPALINNIKTPNLIKRKRLGLTRSTTKIQYTPTVSNNSNEIITPDNTNNKLLDKFINTNPEINVSTPLIQKNLPLSLRKRRINKLHNNITKKKLNFCLNTSQYIPVAVQENSASSIPEKKDKPSQPEVNQNESLEKLIDIYTDKSCEEISLEISRLKEENLKKKVELEKNAANHEAQINDLKEATDMWRDGFNRSLELLANKMEIEDHNTILNHLNIPLDTVQ